MSTVILQHTPGWVWAVLVALTASGLSQTRSREVGLTRVTVIALLLATLSLAGVLSAFGESAVALGAWVAGVAATLFLGRAAFSPRGATWSASSRRLSVPGSWLPLVLMLGLFAVKYAVGARLGMYPADAHDTVFGGIVGLVYGLFAGVFLGRFLGLRSLAVVRSANQPTPA